MVMICFLGVWHKPIDLLGSLIGWPNPVLWLADPVLWLTDPVLRLADPVLRLAEPVLWLTDPVCYFTSQTYFLSLSCGIIFTSIFIILIYMIYSQSCIYHLVTMPEHYMISLAMEMMELTQFSLKLGLNPLEEGGLHHVWCKCVNVCIHIIAWSVNMYQLVCCVGYLSIHKQGLHIGDTSYIPLHNNYLWLWAWWGDIKCENPLLNATNSSH